jgi:hypothetical protein
MGLLRNKHGVYYVRKKVPKQLEHAVARVLGEGKERRTILKKSLRTKELQEAKRKAPAVLMQFDSLSAHAQRRLDRDRPDRDEAQSASNSSRLAISSFARAILASSPHASPPFANYSISFPGVSVF